ncbi:MAG: nickel pincer cofactor biosynthesis protein LarC [Cyanobacteria bacterium P01_G01_bin.38]
MGKIAYLDCPSGISGDMCLGALLDAGLPLAALETGLANLGLSTEYTLAIESVQRCGQAATQLTVELLTKTHPRHLPEIEQLILKGALPEQVTRWSLAIFHQLAEAEAAVHGIPPEQVHFHEVGATDAIVDIVGTCLGLNWLEVEAVYCSALPTGGGTVWAAHGQLPVPAPAVLKLMTLAQVPIYSNGIEKELVTPTGAAIATTLAQQFGPPPPMQLQQVGLGAGGRDLPIPNILRLWLGNTSTHDGQVVPIENPVGQSRGHQHHHKDHHHHGTDHPDPIASDLSPLTPSPPHPFTPSPPHPFTPSPPHPSTSPEQASLPLETLTELQTQLDDLSPQAIGYLYDQLFAAGAVDVFTQAIGMKKNRPGTLLTVLCPDPVVAACETVLFAETTTLGVRRTQQQRQVLHRELVAIATPHGDVRIKIARRSPTGPILNLQPEYEDCAQLARAQALPWKHIHQSALSCAYRKFLPQPEQ